MKLSYIRNTGYVDRKNQRIKRKILKTGIRKNEIHVLIRSVLTKSKNEQLKLRYNGISSWGTPWRVKFKRHTNAQKKEFHKFRKTKYEFIRKNLSSSGMEFFKFRKT